MEPTVGPIPIRDGVNAWLFADTRQRDAVRMHDLASANSSRLHAAPDALPLMPLTRVPTEAHDVPEAVVANSFGPQCGSLM